MPVWVQNLMCSIKGYLIMNRRYGKGFYDELKALEQGVYNPAEELKTFLDCASRVPFYAKVFSANTGKDGYELLKQFPILTKDVVKEHISEIENNSCTEPRILMRTSGTTGGGLVFPYTVRMENRHWAIWWRYRRRLGIDFNTWCGWFGGKRIISPNQKSSPYWRINKPGKQVMYSSMHLSSATIQSFHEDIAERGLTWLHGYPSHISKFAALALDKGLIPLTKVRWITTGAENLIGNQILLIQQIFPNAMIRQHYGLMEGVANLSQDIEGKWHIDDDFAFVELIEINNEDDRVNSDVVRCRIIGTGFSNPAFPLIRYDTGDIAEIKWKIIDNERIPEIIKIEGRSSNVIKGPDDFEINEARLSIILHDFNNIIEAQFVQHSLVDIDLNIVKNSVYDERDESKLRANIEECFDKRMRIKFVYVNEIERTKSGKLKLVISKLIS